MTTYSIRDLSRYLNPLTSFDPAVDVIDLVVDATWIQVKIIDGGAGTQFLYNGNNPYYTDEFWIVDTNVSIGQLVGGVNVIAGSGLLVIGDNTLDTAGDALGNSYAVTITEGVQYHGRDGNDSFTGGIADDLAYGNLGNDMLLGGAGGDSLYGGQGIDVIHGGLGDNLIYGNLDADSMVTGSGHDTVFGGQGADIIQTGGGNDIILGNRGSDSMISGAGADTFVFAPGNGNDNDVIMDFAAGDAINIRRATVTNVTDAGGHAVIQMSSGDTITVLNTTAAEARAAIHSGIAGQTFDGTTGADTLRGTSGADTILGHGGNDLAHGGNGDDFIETGRAHDTIFGEGGNDTIITYAGDDLVVGGSGDDSLDSGGGGDTVFGGLGNDFIDIEGANMTSRAPNVAYGGPGNDTIFGSGSDAPDSLYGGSGNDYIWAGTQMDFIFGEEGNDTIVTSYSQVQILSGGPDADVYIITELRGPGHNVITDFNPAEDRIDLEMGIDFQIGNAADPASIDRASFVALTDTPGGDVVMSFVNLIVDQPGEQSLISFRGLSSADLTDANGNLLDCIWLGAY